MPSGRRSQKSQTQGLGRLQTFDSLVVGGSPLTAFFLFKSAVIQFEVQPPGYSQKHCSSCVTVLYPLNLPLNTLSGIRSLSICYICPATACCLEIIEFGSRFRLSLAQGFIIGLYVRTVLQATSKSSLRRLSVGGCRIHSKYSLKRRLKETKSD